MHYLALLINISHQSSPDYTAVDNRAFGWHFINGKSTTALRRKRDQLLASEYWEPYHTSRLRIDGRHIGWPMAWKRFASYLPRKVYETSDFAWTKPLSLSIPTSFVIHGSVWYHSHGLFFFWLTLLHASPFISLLAFWLPVPCFTGSKNSWKPYQNLKGDGKWYLEEWVGC